MCSWFGRQISNQPNYFGFFCSADGNFEVTLSTKVTLKSEGLSDNRHFTSFIYCAQCSAKYVDLRAKFFSSKHKVNIFFGFFCSADGNFEVTLSTKATLKSDGLVEWKPPAIYHSSCEMDVEYFPFDEQTCVMKFGSWTYDGFQVNLLNFRQFFKRFEWILIGILIRKANGSGIL